MMTNSQSDEVDGETAVIAPTSNVQFDSLNAQWKAVVTTDLEFPLHHHKLDTPVHLMPSLSPESYQNMANFGYVKSQFQQFKFSRHEIPQDYPARLQQNLMTTYPNALILEFEYPRSTWNE